MESFGFNLKQVYGLFELKCMTLFMLLITCAWSQDSIPSFNVTCDSSGLHVKIAFSKPFSGIVYAKGYRFDPLCIMTGSSILDGSLPLPLTACGTFVQGTNHLYITNTIAIQQHPLIKTVNDLEKSIICSLPNPFENFWDSDLLLDQIYESHSLAQMNSSYIRLGSDVYEDNSVIFDNSSTRLTIFQLLNGSIYKEFVIKSCIAHNAEILAGNASVHQITNPEECFTTDSDSSGLTIIRTDKGLMAYVDIKNLKIESSDSFYLTCEVILCKNKCKCSEIDQHQTEQSSSVISHKITKRSVDTSEIFSLKQYEARTRYLKSTVKALMDKITEQRKQNDKSKIRKRLMRLDDSSSKSETQSVGSAIIASTEIFSPEPASREIYEIKPHLVDVYQESDPDEYHHESDLDKYYQESDPDEYHWESDPNEYHRESDPNEHHRESDPDEYHRESDPDEYHQESDPDESHQDSTDDPSPTTHLSTADSGIVVKLPKEFNGNGSEKFLRKGTRVLNDGGNSSENEAPENVNTIITSTFPSTVGIAIDQHGNCIPRLRFKVVIIVMGFLIGCLSMVGCGMALYIRKEKKRHKFNDFLLYSISF